MINWHDRTIEERNLLNPAFCTVVLWHLAKGFQNDMTRMDVEEAGLPLQLAFVGTSLVLRGRTREQLPRSIATTLTAWIHSHPLERSSVAQSVIALRPYIREALIFGIQHGALSLPKTSLLACKDLSRYISNYLRQSSAEVKECAQRAKFVGRWLQKGGSVPTIMALLGMKV